MLLLQYYANSHPIVTTHDVRKSSVPKAAYHGITAAKLWKLITYSVCSYLYGPNWQCVCQCGKHLVKAKHAFSNTDKVEADSSNSVLQQSTSSQVQTVLRRNRNICVACVAHCCFLDWISPWYSLAMPLVGILSFWSLNPCKCCDCRLHLFSTACHHW